MTLPFNVEHFGFDLARKERAINARSESMVEVFEINDLETLQRFAPKWETLFEDCSCPTPFASFEWLFQWWSHFGPGIADEAFQRACGAPHHPVKRFQSPLLVFAAYDFTHELIGLAPFYVCAQNDTKIPIRVLRLVGDAQPRQENPSEEPTVLLRRGSEEAAALAIRIAVEDARTSRSITKLGRWDYAGFQFYANNLAGSHRIRRSSNHARRTETTDRSSRPVPRSPSVKLTGMKTTESEVTTEIVCLPDSWGTFRSSLSKSMRDNLSYYPRLLSRHGHTYRVRAAVSSEDVCRASPHLIHLHRLRSGSAPGFLPHRDHIPTVKHENFLIDTLSSLAGQGMASVWLLEVEGKPIAAQATLEAPDGLCIYYSGFDPEWGAYSPLTILSAEIIKDAIQRGVTRLNLFANPNQWKARWGAQTEVRSRRITEIMGHPLSLARCSLYSIARIARRIKARMP